MVPMLREPCRNIIITNLSPETIWEVYTYSVTFGDDVLREGCRRYLWKQEMLFEEVLALPDFLNIPYEVLLDLLQLNNTNFELPWEELRLGILISEKELFIACHAWAVEECKRQNIQISGPNKRKVLGDSRNLANFHAMASNDIINIVLPTEILSEHEKTVLINQSLMRSRQKAELQFLSSTECFPVDIKHVMEHRLVRAVNKSKQHPDLTAGEGDRRSTVHVTPSETVTILQVWLEPRQYGYEQRQGQTSYGRQCSRYEVVFKHGNRIQSREFAVSKLMGTVEDPVLLVVDIEPFELEANLHYSIRVEHKAFVQVDPTFPLCKERLESFLSEVRLFCGHVLDVTSDEKNKCIVGFTVSHGDDFSWWQEADISM